MDDAGLCRGGLSRLRLRERWRRFFSLRCRDWRSASGRAHGLETYTEIALRDVAFFFRSVSTTRSTAGAGMAMAPKRAAKRAWRCRRCGPVRKFYHRRYRAGEAVGFAGRTS